MYSELGLQRRRPFAVILSTRSSFGHLGPNGSAAAREPGA
jgi:hypothetical protein